MEELKEGDKMKGYINLTNGKIYLLGKSQFYLQSESGKMGYFFQKDEFGLDRCVHSFRNFGKEFIY